MKNTSFRENASAVSSSNIIEFRAYQRMARRRRSWGWWGALLFSPAPEKQGRATPVPAVSSGAVVKFRRQIGAARW